MKATVKNDSEVNSNRFLGSRQCEHPYKNKNYNAINNKYLNPQAHNDIFSKPSLVYFSRILRNSSVLLKLVNRGKN